MSQPQIWEEGQSGNPNGRPAGKAAKPISSLRRTLNQLKKLEKQALDNIEAVVNGKKVRDEDGVLTEVEKQRLDTSKWVITTISALSRSATQEEALKLQVKRGDAPQAQQQEPPEQEAPKPSEDGKVLKFPQKSLSMDILPDVDDDEE